MRARKGWAAVFAALVMTAVQAANLSVTDVKIAQRYPWNGLVDITYTVNCDDPNKDVWVYPVGYDADKDASVALMPEYLSGAGASNAVHNGTHQMTWDMAKQMGKGYNRAAFSVKLHAYCDAAPYMVIDLSAGSEAEKYPVTYLSEIPEGGWTDEPYKTTKMVFRLILPGKVFGEDATLTKPYYFAIYPLSEQQYSLVAGGTPKTPNALKEGVSYDTLRGNVLGSKWPQHQQVDGGSVIGKMRLRTGITIDLPTVAQWCRAVRADVRGGTATVVSPNEWGIAEIGTLGEWCLDWGNGLSRSDYDNYNNVPRGYHTPEYRTGVDPLGATNNPKSARVVCGIEYYGGQFLKCLRGYESYIYGLPQYSTSSSDVGYILPDKGVVSYNGNWGSSWSKGLGTRLVALPVCK